jgi:hypothetical protein
MKPNLPLTLLSAALLAVSAAIGQTATSPTVGFSTLSCPAGSSIVVPTLVNSSVFQGQAAISSDGLTITPVTAPGWTAGTYSKTTFSDGRPNYPKYYAEVVSGGNEGLVLDIDNNSATALTMILPVTPSALRGTTVQIAVREHVTLDKIATGATGLNDIVDSADVYNTNGTRSTRLYSSGTWMTDDFTYNAGHTVIYPGYGFVLSCSGAVTLNFMGEVKPTKTQVPVYANIVNIVGPLSPASEQKLYNNTLATALQPILDSFNTFSTDGALTIQSSYLSDGSQITDQTFTPLTAGSPDSISLNRGIVVSVTGDAVWTVPSPLTP